MSIFSMFSGGQQPAPQQAAQQNNDPQQFQQAQVPQAAQKPTEQGTGPQEQVNPLDQFAKMWEAPKPPEGGADDGYYRFNSDSNKLQQAISSLDFTKTIQPELMQKALSGDQQAFAQVLNTQAQTMFSQMMQVSTKMIEEATHRQADKLQSTLPTKFKDLTSQAEVSKLHPAFNNPGAKPLVEGVRRQFASNNPDATPEQLAKMVNEYLTTFSSQLTAGQAGNQEQTAKDQGNDWLKWASS